MCSRYIFCFLFIVILNFLSTTNAEIEPDDYIPEIDSARRDEFDWMLLKTLSLNENKNVIVSPISLKILLALIYDGSGGSTEVELQNVLKFNANKTIVRQEYFQIINSLLNLKSGGCENTTLKNDRDFYTLNFGTRIFLDSEVQPQQAFQAKACEKYRTKIEAVNFTDTYKTSAKINEWTDVLTEGRIKAIVQPDDIRDSILLLSNVIYFKGLWRSQFPKNQSYIGGFYISPTERVNVPYMATTDKYYFAESKHLDANVIRIPYRGNKFSMILVLPNSKAGLSNLIQYLNPTTFRRTIALMDKVSVDLILPKFTFDFSARLSNTLKTMGLESMFKNTASLGGITRGPNVNLVVSDILQKSGIEVNEEGSVAFSSTDIQIGNKFGEAQYIFNATHPFLFFIEDQTSNTVLFLGKVENPLEATSVPLPPRLGEITPAAQMNPTEKTSSFVNPEAADPPPFQLNPSWEQEVELSTERFGYFDLELLREISSNENVFLSPASIKATLGMVLEGARGICAEEIIKTLRLPLRPNESRHIIKPLIYELSDHNQNLILESANGIFLSNKLQVVDSYKKIIEEEYKGFVKSVDFTNPATAANIINAWVNEKTMQLIPKLVSQDNLASKSSIVIANALFFKGLWKKSFDEKNTMIRCFELPSRQCRPAYMMQNNDDVVYKTVENINAEALSIPYNDGKYSMLFLLPRSKNNIRGLMRDLQHYSFGRIVDELDKTEKQDVQYEIPRFQIEYTVDLVHHLKELGIREIFEESANLTGIVTKGQVLIDNIVHKAKIQVNEKGTTAAAATGAVVVPLMGSSTPKFIADHPFVFFIYKTDNRNILFEGIVNKPLEAPAQHKRSG